MATADKVASERRPVAAPARALRRRGDPKFLRLTAALSERLAAPKFALVPVRDLLAERIAYGTSSRLDSEPPGCRSFE